MKRSSKLSLALHALGHMAQEPARARTSEEIAAMHGTHAVVVRRVFAPLREAGILLSEKGHGGGWRLARPAAEISLADIYAAIGEPFLTATAFAPAPGHPCAIEAAMTETVSAAMVEAEAVIARHFAARTLADVAKVWGERVKSASHPTDSPL